MVDNNGNGHKPHDDLKPVVPTRNKLTDERLTAFLALYVANDFHAVNACIALGMRPESADAHAHRYVEAIRSRLSLQQAMREAGLDVRRIARKLDKMMDAKEPKWNLYTKQWDHFENTTAQLEAIKQTARLLNLYPAEPEAKDALTVNVIFDVKP